MDLRSLIDKLDTIEQKKLLLESEELMERVGLRLSDIEQAVGRELDGNKRAAIIGDFARKFGYAGLFDPVSGKFVNKDGKFASFGAYQSEVEQLEDEGLIPNSAKTDALLGFMGKDEKAAKPNAFARADLFGAIDKADGLLDKALDGILESKGIANSLLAEFGINTHLLEAITPEEHKFLKKTVKDAESIKHKADASNLITRYTKEYVPARNRLIKQIQTVIASIKPASSNASPVGQRSGSAASANESLYESIGLQDPAVEKAFSLLKGTAFQDQLKRDISLSNAARTKSPELYKEGKEFICELSATQKGVVIHKPDWKGYLSPEKVKHNLEMLRQGKAKLDWSDHVGQSVADWANMATFGLADKASAYLSSIGEKPGTYEKELQKFRDSTNAYNKSGDALNLRKAAGAVGIDIAKDNSLGNATVGDIAGLFGPGIPNLLFKGGSKIAGNLGGKTLAKLAGGTAAVVPGAVAAHAIGEPGSKGNKVNPQPGKTEFDPEIKKLQEYLIKIYGGKEKILPKYGADGKYGDETKKAIERAQKDGKLPGGDAKADSGEVNSSAVATQAQSDGSAVAAAPSGDASSAAPSGDTSSAVASASANDGNAGEDLAKIRANAGLTGSANDGKAGEVQGASPVAVASAPASAEGTGIDLNTIKAALAKLGANKQGAQITADQLLALADELGIKDQPDATVSAASADTTGGATMRGLGSSDVVAQAKGNDFIQGIVGESLGRILALSGLAEESNLNEGPLDKFASWVIDDMIAAGGRKATQSQLANLPAIGPRAAEIAAAKRAAREIERQGIAAGKGKPNAAPPASSQSATANAPPATANAQAAVTTTDRAATGALDPAGEAARKMVGKTPQQLQAMATNQSLTALERKAAKEALEKLGIKVGDDAAAGAAKAGADDAASATVRAGADDAASATVKAAEQRLVADAAKGEGLLYKLGFAGGRFVRLLKNPKFLALLAALTVLGVGVYLATRDNKDEPPQPQPVDPNVVPVGPDGKCPAGYKLSADKKTCVKDTGPAPAPGPDPKEEERKRQLADLEKLLAQLYGGWPTDPETAETIKAAVAAGAKAPAGFTGSDGGVQTQPAGSGSTVDSRTRAMQAAMDAEGK